MWLRRKYDYKHFGIFDFVNKFIFSLKHQTVIVET